MSDAISQLKEMNHEWTDDSAASGTLNILYSNINEFVINASMVYNTTLIKIDSRFKRKLIIDYIKN